MGTLNEQTIEKRETIKNAGYKHVSTYECQLKKNKDFQRFAKGFDKEVVELLNPRDAFYGSRSNATKLLYNFKENECGATSISVRCIQQYNSIRNIRLVSPAKFSTQMNMTNRGTD